MASLLTDYLPTDYLGWLGLGDYAKYLPFLQLLDRQFLKDLILEEPVVAKEFVDVLKKVIVAARKQLHRKKKEAYIATLESLHKLIMDEMNAALTS